MNRILLALLLTFSISANAEVWQARYGISETFDFKLYNADGTLDVDEADGGTEVSVSCNEGAETTATNDFTDEGTFYSIVLTASEMQCERITVVVAATTTEVFFIQTHSNASAMTPQADANVTQYGGSAGTFASGRPEVNTSHISGDSGAADELELAFDGATGAVESLGIARQGTAQSATGTTIVLDSSAAFGDDTVNGMTVVACGSTQGYCQARAVTDYVNSTDTATVPTWTVTPSGTITYYLFATAPATSSGSGATAQEVWEYATRSLTILDEDSTTLDLNTTTVGTVGTVGSGAISTSSFAAGAINAAAVATDAIGAAEVAADAVTEIQSGLATASALSTVDDFVDTEVAAIKAKTDQLTFTVTGQVDANAESMNGVEILGSGTSADPWNGE